MSNSQRVSVSQFTQLRLAVVLNGGVSLAVWIGGVCDELLRLVIAGRALRAAATNGVIPEPAADVEPYQHLCFKARVFPVVDVMTGASAGGLNSVLLGAALSHGRTDLADLRETWIELGQMENLLREPGSGDMVSLMSGDYFLDGLRGAIRQILADPYCDPSERDEPPLDVQLTATSLDGRTQTIGTGIDALYDTTHAARFTFSESDFLSDDPKQVERLAIAARASASFPGAFEPVRTDVALFNDDCATRLVGIGDRKVEYLIDGGVLANLPAAPAIDAIVNQKASGRVRRVAALVVPDPTTPAEGVVATKQRDVLQVIGAAAVSIPRTQSLDGFMKAVEDHNKQVVGTRAARQGLFEQFATDPGSRGQAIEYAQRQFPVYRKRRYEEVISVVESRIFALPNYRRPEIDQLVFIPRAMELSGDGAWCWGSRTPRHLATILLTLLDVMERTGQGAAYAELKETVTAQLEPSYEGSLVKLLRKGDPATRWPATDDPSDEVAMRGELNARIKRLAEVAVRMAMVIPQGSAHGVTLTLAGFAELVQPDRFDPAAAPSTEDEKIETACTALLALEVLESTFGGFTVAPDQMISVANITSRGQVMIDANPERNQPGDKLTGSRLGHFGAFLLPSWRANDWMWGRLDASERLVKLVAEPTSDDRAYGMQAEGTVSDEVLESLTRAAQKRILNDELAFIADQTDHEEGDRRRQQARRAAEEASLRRASIGEETMDGLIGSRRFTEIVAKASNNLTTMLSQRGPKALRGTSTLAGGVTTTIWRLNKLTRRSEPVLAALYGALFTIVAVVAVGSIDTLWRTDDQDSWVPQSVETAVWGLLVTMIVLGAIIVPSPTMILVGVGALLTCLRWLEIRCADGHRDSWWCEWRWDWLAISGRLLGISLMGLGAASLLLWFWPKGASVVRRATRSMRWWGALLAILAVTAAVAWIPDLLS